MALRTAAGFPLFLSRSVSESQEAAQSRRISRSSDSSRRQSHNMQKDLYVCLEVCVRACVCVDALGRLGKNACGNKENVNGLSSSIDYRGCWHKTNCALVATRMAKTVTKWNRSSSHLILLLFVAFVQLQRVELCRRCRCRLRRT